MTTPVNRSTVPLLAYDPIFDRTKCLDYDGYFWAAIDYGLIYGVNGLPIPTPFTEIRRVPMAFFMCFLATLGFLLNIFCLVVLFKSFQLSKAVKCYLSFDCYCRLNEATTYFYHAHCVWTWHCVDTQGSPISGITVNRIVTAFLCAMFYSMQFLQNGLCLNRIFAVTFNGLQYKRVEMIALPHCVVLWMIPIIAYLYEIDNLHDPVTGFICYAGFAFTPSEYSNWPAYYRNQSASFIALHIDHFMYAILVITMFIDVLTLRKIRTLMKSSELRKKLDRRLSIMLIVNHSVTVTYFIFNQLANSLIVVTWPVYYFLIMKLPLFLLNQAISCIVIAFYLERKRKGVISVGAISSARIR